MSTESGSSVHVLEAGATSSARASARLVVLAAAPYRALERVRVLEPEVVDRFVELESAASESSAASQVTTRASRLAAARAASREAGVAVGHELEDEGRDTSHIDRVRRERHGGGVRDEPLESATLSAVGLGRMT